MSENLERRIYHAEEPIARVILAHGAGAGNQHDFMDFLANKLCEHNLEVISFNFDYMVRQYQEEKKRPPDRQPKLIERFVSEINIATSDRLPIFVAGKSMGGRMATLLDHDSINGILVYGYPFIPPGKPEKLQQRTEHFSAIKVPTLICQGERDTFGNLALLNDIKLPECFALHWIESGDHSFKPLKSSGLSSEQNIEKAAELSFNFIQANI